MASSSANTPVVNLQKDPRHSGHSDTPDAVEPYTLIPQELSKDPTKWTRAELQTFLTHNKTKYDLDDSDIKVFLDRKVPGSVFLRLTRERLCEKPYNLEDGAADVIEGLINELKESQVAQDVLRFQHPNEYRRKRFHDIRMAVEPKAKKVKSDAKKAGGKLVIGYSSINWGDVQHIYDPLLRKITILPKPIPDDTLESLYRYLCKLTRAFGVITSGKEAKRLHFIALIIVHINDLFEDMKILVEEPVPGEALHLNGHFEFILQRGAKKICVIEAKKEDMDQGTTQDLLGCDAVANAEGTSCVFGIVTNYVEWIFFRSFDDHIDREYTSLPIESDQVSKEGLNFIAGKIYALLADEPVEVVKS